MENLYGTRKTINLYNLIETLEVYCLLGQEDTTWLWHKILGHINFKNLTKIITKEVVREMQSIFKPYKNICPSCQKCKQNRTSFKDKEHHSRKSLELIHTDICGPTKTQSIHGHRYFIFFIGDYSRMTWVHLLKHKSEYFDMFVCFKNMIEN